MPLVLVCVTIVNRSMYLLHIATYCKLMKFGISITIAAMISITFAWYIFRYLPVTAYLPDGLNHMELNIIYVVRESFVAVLAKNVAILMKKKLVSLVKIKTAMIIIFCYF